MKSILIFFLLLPILVKGQEDTVVLKRTDFGRGIEGVIHVLSSPVRWKGKDWLTLSGVAAGTVAISLLDEPVRNLWKSEHSELLDNFEKVGYHYGKFYSAAAVTGGFYFTGIILKNEWAKETGLMLASALTTSTIIHTILKAGIGRARPYSGMDNYVFKPFSSSVDYHAFPSGHTTVAFTMSVILARQVKPVILKIVFYSLATCTALSRMYIDAHWISDVAVGGTIGWFCADAALKRISANQFHSVIRSAKKISWKLYPYPGGLSLRASL